MAHTAGVWIGGTSRSGRGRDRDPGSGGGRRRRTKVLAIGLLASLGAMLTVSQQYFGSAGAAVFPPNVVEPPLAPTAINVFSERDFVSIDGLDDTKTFEVQVWRSNSLIGRVDGLTSVGGLVEVNHPGGACWSTVTPDIVAGDQVIVISKDPTSGAQVTAQATTTADVRVTAPASAAPGSDVVVVRGTASDVNGNPLPIGSLEVRITGTSANAFDVNGRRDLRAIDAGDDGVLQYDAPGSTAWTATFVALSPADVTRATEATSQILWLGRDPAAGVESTHFESPGAPGPWSPACNAPLQGPAIGTDVTSIDFPSTAVGSSAPVRSIVVTNTGHDLEGLQANLVIDDLAVTGDAGFQIVPGAGTCVTGAPLAIGATCRIEVQFSPTTDALAQASLRISSNAGGGVVSIPLTGLGRVADIGSLRALPAHADFGTITPGVSSREQTIRLRNDGNAAVSVQDLVIDSAGIAAGFTVSSASDCLTGPIDGGAECTFGVVFVPSTAGPLAGTVTVDSDIAADVVVNLAGTGLVTDSAVPLPGSGVDLGVFYARDFVSVGGFVPDELLTMQIIRNGVVVGYAHNVVAGADGVAEVNHPGGSCWENVTPDIRPFDVLRVTRPDGRYYETTTADVGLDGHATYVREADGTYTVEVHGWARTADGAPLPLSQLEARLVASSADPFDLSGRRTVRTPDDGVLFRDTTDNPDGTRVTARWTGMTEHDARLAADPGVDSRLMWLGADPVALSELTFFEHGSDVANGPWDPSCGAAAAASAGFAASPSTVSFSNVHNDGTGGVANSRTVTIRNTGNAPLDITRLAIHGASSDEFAVVGAAPTTIAPAGRATITLVFDPTHTGPAEATLVISDTALGSPHRIALSGAGTDDPVASIVVTPSTLEFPDTRVGDASEVQLVTITNEGSLPLDLTTITFQGADATAFALRPTGPSCSVEIDVAQGSSCTLAVKFRPAHVNDSTGSLVITSNAVNAASATVALRGTSSITADNVYDPPRAPASVEVFPVRDYVFGQGFGTEDFVDVQVIRNGQVIATEENIVPLDDPATTGFDGIVEINHGAPLAPTDPVVCWSGRTPDIVTGDIVRMTVKNGVGAMVASHQTHTQGVEVSMPATQVAPGTVQIAGYASDIFTSGSLGDLEVRIVGTSRDAFDLNGRRSLRTGGEGSISWVTRDATGVGTLSGTPAGREWIATFSGLSSADVARAVGGQSVVLWLGRDALAGTELTHAEWGEVVGPAGPDCTAPAERAEPTVSATDLMVGYGNVGTPSAARSITFTNPGPGPITVTAPGVEHLSGPQAADFDVTASTCPATLAANASCTVSVRFDPRSDTLGGRYASLAIRHSGANGVTFVPIRGVTVAPPTITEVSPAPPARVDRGRVFRVTGTDLASTSAVSVAGVAQTFTVVSDTQLDVTVAQNTPISLTAATLVVTTAGGSVTKAGAVVVAPLAPTVTSVTPTTVLQGGTVTFTGTNLLAVQSVVFGGNAAATTFSSGPTGTSLTATVPQTATTGGVRITTAGGAVTTASLTVTSVPRITGFNVATVRTGATLTITGANLRPATGVPSVTFNGAAAVNGTANAAGTSVTVVVPAAANQGTVTVTVAGRTATSPTELVVERAPSNLTLPTATVLRGSTITITGRNFLTTSSVTIGKVSATFTIVNASQLTVTVPATAVSGTVSITNRWGRTTSGATLNVARPPTVTGLSATSVSNNTGTATVSINGTNFTPGVGTTSVTIGTTSVVVSTLTATRVTVIVPTTLAEGIYTVRVTTAAGTAAAATGLTVT